MISLADIHYELLRIFTMTVFKLVLCFTVIDFRLSVAVLPQYTPITINADGLTRVEIIRVLQPRNELRRNIKVFMKQIFLPQFFLLIVLER